MFGEKLKELRKEKKLTQDDIAKIFNVTYSTVSAWEVGKAQPNYYTLTKLAEYFNVTPNYLLGFNQQDKDNLNRLETALKESGIDDIDKAMKILDVLKKEKDTK